MTSREIYSQYLQKLRKIYSATESDTITNWIFEDVANLKRADIVKEPNASLSALVLEQLAHCLVALLQHRPVQYVLGEAWFYKMKFKVNEDVLIPRPETEELVQWVIDDSKSSENNARLLNELEGSGSNLSSVPNRELSMLDIGTGSGCIAIALKKTLPGSEIYAIDVSASALSIARENAARHQVDIHFSLLDFLDDSGWGKLPVFDVIISNPPYIPLNEKDRLGKNVSAFEPHTALFVPENNPVLFYQKIAAFGKEHLQRGGKIYMEIHEDFAKATVAVFEEQYEITLKKDIFGKERMLLAVKKPFREVTPQ